MRDTSNFAEHFISLLKNRGPKDFSGSLLAGSNFSREPLKSGWFPGPQSTGSSILAATQPLISQRTTGTTGTTIFDDPPSNGAIIANGNTAPPEDHPERAAIIEFGAAVPRAWAEGFAGFILSRPPTGLSPDRWERAIDDGGRFIDRWATTADSLGWQVSDAFDEIGLVPLINGGEILEISTHIARIRTVEGKRQSFIRGLGKVGLWNTEPGTVR